MKNIIFTKKSQILIKIYGVAIILLIVTLSAGCLQTNLANQKQPLDELFDFDKPVQKEVSSKKYEIDGNNFYAEGMKYYENKQYAKAKESFENAENEFIYARLEIVEVKEIWRIFYSDIQNKYSDKFSEDAFEIMNDFLKNKYWLADVRGKQYASMSDYCQYLSIAMGYLNESNSELANKYLEKAKEEQVKTNSFIITRNEYVNKTIEFEEKLGIRPTKLD